MVEVTELVEADTEYRPLETVIAKRAADIARLRRGIINEGFLN